MGKRSKHPIYDDPSAFKKQFPVIRETDEAGTNMREVAPETTYKMGKLTAVVSLTPMGYFMSVHGKDCYPTWDEMVWLRYNLIPDAAVMALILPNLDKYINIDGMHHQFVFTMEQKSWALVKLPECPTCQRQMELKHTEYAEAEFICKCGDTTMLDLSTWNEENGSGFKAK